jgi:ribonuclease Z
MIQSALRYACGFAGLFFLLLGLTFLLKPGRLAKFFGVVPAGNAGFGALRGDLGGLFLGMAVYALLGAVFASGRLLAVPAVFLSFIVFGRLLNLLFDGRSREGVRSLALELVLATALGLAVASLLLGRVAQPFGLGLLIAPPVVALAVLIVAFAFQRPIGLALTKRVIERTIGRDLLGGLPDGLHVGLCGSGSPLPDATRAGPCVVVIAGKRVYVVDAGDGSARKMALMGLSPGTIDAIFITHFHSDHIGGLGELMLQRWANAAHTEPVAVIGPQGVDAVVQGFRDAYAADTGYRVAHHGVAIMPPSGAGGVARPFTIAAGADAGQVVLQQDGLTVTAFPVIHTPVFPAVGYRFDYGGRSVVISGDTAPSPAVAETARGADVLLHDGLQTAVVSLLGAAAVRHNRKSAARIMADIPSYHATPEDAARTAQEAGVRRLVFYHMIPPIPVAYLNAVFLGDAPKFFKGPITVAKDGLFLSLPAGTTNVTTQHLL